MFQHPAFYWHSKLMHMSFSECLCLCVFPFFPVYLDDFFFEFHFSSILFTQWYRIEPWKCFEMCLVLITWKYNHIVWQCLLSKRHVSVRIECCNATILCCYILRYRMRIEYIQSSLRLREITSRMLAFLYIYVVDDSKFSALHGIFR